MNSDTLVIGGGISGIAAAWELRRAGVDYLLCEASATAGGSISTRRRDGYLWEEGPSSFLPKPEILSLIHEAGLDDEIICADRKLPRFIYHGGRLRAVPTGLGAFIGSDLLSFGAKLRLISGLCGFVPQPAAGEESVYAFFSRHLGREVADRLIEPFVSGVYAGDVRALTSRAVFAKLPRIAGQHRILPGIIPGLIRSALKGSKKTKPAVDPALPQIKRGTLCNLRAGLDSLPAALSGAMGEQVRCSWRATAVAKTAEGFLTTFATPEGSCEVRSRQLVLALPAYEVAELLSATPFKAAAALRAIEYPAVASVISSWDCADSQDAPVGFGFLTPRSEGVRSLGSVFTSNLFPGRCPDQRRLFSSFIGGATDSAIADLEPAAIGHQVIEDLARCVGIPAERGQSVATRIWPKAIPQYTMGHLERVAAIEAAQAELPGLALVGNYFNGVSLGDCIRTARERVAPLL